MKTNIDTHKLDVAKDAERALSGGIVNYTPGDLPALGEICNSIIVLAEFYESELGKKYAARAPKIIEYLGGMFQNCIVLVLKDENRYFGYTAKNVVKFIRGESLHGRSENLDQKRTTLHCYVFEKSDEIECEFHIGWNWICGPNLRAASGNLDSNGLFLHVIKINGNRIEVSLFESIILAIAFEFWQRSTNGQPEASTKCFVKFNPDWYSTLWGEELAARVNQTLVGHMGITLTSTADV